MAARNTTHMTATLQRGLIELFLKGTGNGAADITLTYGLGVSATLTYAATGKYTITLSDKYTALVGFSASVLDATTEDDWEVVPLTEAVSTTKTIQFAVFKGGTAAALTSDEKIMVRLTLLNSAITPVKGG